MTCDVWLVLLLFTSACSVEVMSRSVNRDLSPRFKRGALANRHRLWVRGVIPYEYDVQSAWYTPWAKSIIYTSMRYWEAHTCIKFVERAPEHSSYARFSQHFNHCCATPGRSVFGPQIISLAPICMTMRSASHELGHLIGFEHEHERPDRDNYVRIHHQNVESGWGNTKYGTDHIDSLGQPYDFDSVMHYWRSAAAKYPGLVTIEALPNTTHAFRPYGVTSYPSVGDLIQANLLYECPKCGSTMQAPKGRITLNNSSSELTLNANELCEWRITGTAGEHVVLNITDIDFSGLCDEHYLEVRDGYWEYSPLLGKFCTPPTGLIISKSSRMLITYTSTFNGNFSASYEIVCGGNIDLNGTNKTVQSPNYPLTYPANRSCEWIVSTPLSHHQIVVDVKYLSFDQFYIGSCEGSDVLQIEALNGSTITLCEPIQFEFGGKQFKFTTTKLILRFVSNARVESFGFLLNLSTAPIQNAKPNSTQFSSTEGDRSTQSSSTEDDRSTQSSSTEDDRSTQSSSTEERSTTQSSSTEVIISTQSSSTTESSSFEQVSESTTINKPNSCSMHDCEHVCVPDPFSNNLKPYKCECRDGYTLLVDGKHCKCGDIIIAPTGLISSLHFPNSYPLNTLCVWDIVGPKETDRITLNFSHFDLESSEQCAYDRVHVFSMSSYNTINYTHGVYCGTHESPFSVTSSSNILRIEFFSDESVARTGFSASFIADTNECNNHNGYCDHICINTIDAYYCQCKPGYELERDGRACRQTLPPEIEECYHDIREPFGLITSPHYPEPYPKQVNCTWHITTIPGYRIQLRFTDVQLKPCSSWLDLLEQDYIDFQSLTTFNGLTGFTKLCSNQLIGRVFTSATNQMSFRFISNEYEGKKGFKAEYKTVCGADLILSNQFSSNGTMITYNQNDIRHENITYCEWRIVNKNRSEHIKLTFTEINVDCDHFVRVYNVYDYPEERIEYAGGVCENFILPKVFISTGRTLIVKFKVNKQIRDVRFLATAESYF